MLTAEQNRKIVNVIKDSIMNQTSDTTADVERMVKKFVDDYLKPFVLLTIGIKKSSYKDQYEVTRTNGYSGLLVRAVRSCAETYANAQFKKIKKLMFVEFENIISMKKVNDELKNIFVEAYMSALTKEFLDARHDLKTQDLNESMKKHTDMIISGVDLLSGGVLETLIESLKLPK